MIQRLREKRAVLAGLNSEIDDLELEIKTAMQDAEAIVGADGKPIVTWKSSKDSTKTDWKAVANAVAAPKEVVQLFTTTSAGSRRFTLTD